MKVSEIVRRTLADEALQGRRNWANLGDIAFEVGCSVGTVFNATRHLVEIGAVSKHSSGGLSVLDPERVVMSVAARRSLVADVQGSVSLAAAEALMGEVEKYALGGSDAAVHYLGGINTVADHPQRILYVPQNRVDKKLLDNGIDNDVLILPLDTVGARTWTNGFSSWTQAFADLYALAGWQASEFRRALSRELFATNDWERVEEGKDEYLSAR